MKKLTRLEAHVALKSYLKICGTNCWWTRKSPRAHVAKFYGRLLLNRSVLRASKFSVLKLTEIVICGFITPSLLALACFDTYWASLFNFLNYFIWPRITDGGSVPEMRIWSILLITSDLNGLYILEVSFYVLNVLHNAHQLISGLKSDNVILPVTPIEDLRRSKYEILMWIRKLMKCIENTC